MTVKKRARGLVAGSPAEGSPEHATTMNAACGCAAGIGAADGNVAKGTRGAIGVDPTQKQRHLTRLRRIEGQVRGIQKMVDEERYCADVLTQIASVQEALRGVARALMRGHLEHCATSAIQAGPEEAEPMYDELVDLMFRYAR